MEVRELHDPVFVEGRRPARERDLPLHQTGGAETLPEGHHRCRRPERQGEAGAQPHRIRGADRLRRAQGTEQEGHQTQRDQEQEGDPHPDARGPGQKAHHRTGRHPLGERCGHAGGGEADEGHPHRASEPEGLRNGQENPGGEQTVDPGHHPECDGEAEEQRQPPEQVSPGVRIAQAAASARAASKEAPSRILRR